MFWWCLLGSRLLFNRCFHFWFLEAGVMEVIKTPKFEEGVTYNAFDCIDCNITSAGESGRCRWRQIKCARWLLLCHKWNDHRNRVQTELNQMTMHKEPVIWKEKEKGCQKSFVESAKNLRSVDPFVDNDEDGLCVVRFPKHPFVMLMWNGTVCVLCGKKH